ncbi:MAG: HIT family protein [Chlamydiae bacterium]|nr:HIT family protein [Chlamydiota bacterium]
MRFRFPFFIAFFLFAITLQANTYCPFCDSLVLERQAFYEDDLVYALYTHMPITEGHCLVIPKRHVANFEELNDQELQRIGQAIQKVDAAAKKVFSTGPYLLHQKNGKEVGQSVFHVHFHYVPRKIGQSSLMALLSKVLIAQLKGPISHQKMKEVTSKLKENIEK